MQVLAGHTVREPTVHELRVAIEHSLQLRQVRDPTARETQVALEHDLMRRAVEAEALASTIVESVAEDYGENCLPGEDAQEVLAMAENDLAAWSTALVARVKLLEHATSEQTLLFAVALATWEKVDAIGELVKSRRAVMGLDPLPPAEDPRATFCAVSRAVDEPEGQYWLRAARGWVSSKSSPY